MIRQYAVLMFVALLLHTNAAKAQIAVTNHENGSTVRYSVALLQGNVAPGTMDLEIRNTSADPDALPVNVALHEDRFKALVKLVPGRNLLSLHGDHSEKPLEVELNYQPQTNPYYMRFVWMTDNTGDTTFAAPSDDVSQDYEARLRTAALLMQTFTAEKMHQLGLGHRTFRLERDGAGQVVVHTWKTPEEADHYRDLGRKFGQIYGWINREHPDPYVKNVVLASFTRKDPETGKMIAHTALGGGNLGLFGSASVFSWPRDIASAIDVFHDDTKVDPTRVHDDSVGRSTNWGLASTTIGATLHETCHTFGLPHCRDRYCIMTRGFDNFNRAFTFYDPPSGRNRAPKFFTLDEEAYFAPVSADYLRWSRWFQLDDVPYPDDARPRITVDDENVTVTATPESGIPWVGFWVGPDIYTFRTFREFNGGPPQSIVIPRKEIAKMLDGKPLSTVTAISTNGQGSRADMRRLRGKPSR